jgi:hypothetical protein
MRDEDQALADLFPLAAKDPGGFRGMAPGLLQLLTDALDQASRGAREPLLAAIRAAAASRHPASLVAQRLADGDQGLLQVVWDMAVEALVMDALADLWGHDEPDGGRADA